VLVEPQRLLALAAAEEGGFGELMHVGFKVPGVPEVPKVPKVPKVPGVPGVPGVPEVSGVPRVA
jgi:hypothetical protein